MRLCIVGTGYVGLVAGAGFAETGNDVIGVDRDAAKIDALRRNEIPIYEPGLEELVRRNAAAGRLHFSTRLAEGLQDAQALFIAVGTPSGADGRSDLSALWAVADEIRQLLDPSTAAEGTSRLLLVVTKSTVPVGTAAALRERLAGASRPIAVVANPEFLKEGDAVNDFMKPQRVVVGTDSEEAEAIMRQLYAPFVRTRDRIHIMDPVSAELTKYAANAFLATKVTFMNEMANLAEKVGADITSVRLAIGADDRIGARFLFPGVGYGGSCFPKDVRSLVHTARDSGSPVTIVEAVEAANNRQKTRLVDKVRRYFAGDLTGKVVALWGLSFKPRTDDVREAPALEMIRILVAEGATIRAHDPEAMANARSVVGEDQAVVWCEQSYDACEGADALILATEWNSYRTPDFERILALMRGRGVFDGRNLWEPELMVKLGFAYHGIGRPEGATN